MIFSTRLLLDPDRNAVFAVPAMALSLFVFAYSTIFGPISVLAFYGAWFPILLLRPKLLLKDVGRVFPVIVLPALAVLSTIWSDQPSQTLRGGIQYGTTVLCGLIAARVLSVPLLTLGGVVGSLFVLLYSHANGSYAYDVVDGSYAFNGAFASKNQLGYYASLALIFSLATILIFRAALVWRALAVAVAGLAVWTLMLSDSATSLLTVVGAIGVIGAARILFSLPPGPRRGAVLVAIGAGILALVLAWLGGAFGELLQLVGKDATLTGRTYLWNEGLRIGAEDPMLGLGYSAFWTHGRPDAEALWETFYITGRTGFHFHNTLIEAFVALGLVGVALVLGLMGLLMALTFRVLLNRRFVGSAMLCSGLAVLFVVRSFVEIDFFTPYTVGSFLVPYLILRMADQRAEERALRRANAAPPAPPLAPVPRSPKPPLEAIERARKARLARAPGRISGIP